MASLAEGVVQGNGFQRRRVKSEVQKDENVEVLARGAHEGLCTFSCLLVRRVASDEEPFSRHSRRVGCEVGWLSKLGLARVSPALFQGSLAS
jgi:hypothetical protein